MNNTWNTIKIGSPLPELKKNPDYKQIFMFSAITWNRHMIHYNSDRARSEGHSDVVVQRGLLGSYLAQFLSDWASQHGDLWKLDWKVIKSALPGDKLTCKGEITGKEVIDNKHRVLCNILIENQNAETIATGQSTVIIHR